MFEKNGLPMITMGGLYRFEKRACTSAPRFIEKLVQDGSGDPDTPLSPETVQLLVDLIACSFGENGFAFWRATRLLRKSPEQVALALRAFLEDPLPVETQATGDVVAPSAPLPSVLDMRAAWLAHRGDPAVFDGLTLWEHSRILRQQEKHQRAALANGAISARVAQAKDNQFQRFVSEMLTDGRTKTSRDWARHLFSATGHLPRVTQEELTAMKGRA